jgi:hypothetical protein
MMYKCIKVISYMEHHILIVFLCHLLLIPILNELQLVNNQARLL